MNDNDLREGVKWEMGKAFRSGTDADGIAAAVIAYIRQHDGHSDLQERLATVEAQRYGLARMLLHYVRTVPLGHQPHMSAEPAEKMALEALALSGWTES